MLIEEYKENWTLDFEKIREILCEALQDQNISIEHIGSTSIRGLTAKPIVDIDVIFDKNADFYEIKTALEKLGYYHNGNQGIESREVFKRDKTLNHSVLDAIAHHLYACPDDSEELRRHILFRDYLRANSEARIEYQKLKYEIAAEANQDRKRYSELKEIKAKTFVDGVIENALKTL